LYIELREIALIKTIYVKKIINIKYTLDLFSQNMLDNIIGVLYRYQRKY